MMDTPPMNPEFRKTRKRKFTWEILDVFPPAGSYQGMENLNQQFEPKSYFEEAQESLLKQEMGVH
jgi:hypothetical protein